MRFAAVQFDIAWEDKAANHRAIESMLDDAGVEPGTYVLLPELGDTGFSMNLDRIVDERSIAWAKEQARQRKIYLQAGFARLKSDVDPASPPGRNCAAIISPDGKLLGEYQKVHPFSYGKESRFYGGGDRLLLRRCGEAVVCPMICYDLRFPELWRLAAIAGAEVFAIGASWPAERQDHWRSLIIARAIENQAFVVAVNRCGSDPHLQYAGGSLIVAPSGETLTAAGDQPQVISAQLDLASMRAWRAKFPALADVKEQLLGSIKLDMSI
jgi:predicted amidohydrolase